MFITGFLEASLNDRADYRALFYNPAAARDWLPDDIVVTQYRDAGFIGLATNKNLRPEETDLAGGRATFTGMTNAKIVGYKLKDGETSVPNRGLLLEWAAGGEPVYAVRLPDSPANRPVLTPAHSLAFDLVDMSTSERPVATWVELVASDGVVSRLPLDRFGNLPVALPVRLTKAGWIAAAEGYKINTPTPYERLPQTYDLPLAAFEDANPAFRAGNLAQIRILFDGQSQGKVMIDEVGFRVP